MSAKGTFEVELVPQVDQEFAAGRMTINKSYQGGLIGTGLGQMISKRTEAGAAVYYAIEEFSGTLNGLSGAFTLLHRGSMSAESQSLDIAILEGSGVGELKSIAGTMTITQDGDGHWYSLAYSL